ncbi:FAD-binding domain-containing protein [Trametes polyzona]|nr:FAD-binding domain-containing protein [Trametes polyzona]
MGAFPSHLPGPTVSTTAPPPLATPPPTAIGALNATLGGRVHAAVPFSRPCFQLASEDVLGHVDVAACARVIDSYTDRDAITSEFSAYLNSGGTICQATGDQCILDANAPNNSLAFLPPSQCRQGNLPSHYIDVQGPEDVSAAFDYSRRTGTPISVKNTGHDFLSRSAGVGSLSLWMHNLQDLTYSKSFVPSGCRQTGVQAITFGTGVLTSTLNKFADANNVTVPGGADSSIAFGGGYLLGGGHSAFSNAYGLAVDQVLEFEVVTPDGQHRFVNACKNSDLFFALRGGGGATFAVVLRVTMKALPRLQFPVVVTAFKDKPSVEAQTKYIGFLVDNMLPLAAKGMSLCPQYVMAWLTGVQSVGWGGYIEPGLGLTFVNPFISMDEAAKATAGLKQLVETELNGTYLLQHETSYLSFYNQFVEPTTLPDNAPSALSSRLIPAALFNTSSTSAQKRAELRDALVSAAQRHTITLLFSVAPHFFGRGDGQTSVSPAWRDALWHVIYIDYWTYNTTAAERAQIYRGLEADAQVLRRLAPDSGVYWNEASVFEPDYAQAFWGSNYARLLAIKRKHDPHHLLDCWKCVGWKGAADARYKCQQQLH